MGCVWADVLLRLRRRCVNYLGSVEDLCGRARKPGTGVRVPEEIVTILQPNFDYCDRSATFLPLCQSKELDGIL
jgi:hypothetical protein